MTTEEIERLFSRLRGGFSITSPFDESYNCVAFAAGETGPRWWWPGEPADSYWPEGVPREETLKAFEKAFDGLGYSRCNSAEFEPGWEKIAIFCDADGVPTHAARQVLDGLWTSKLGSCEDRKHELSGLEDSSPASGVYGRVAVIMKRRRPG